MEAAKLAVNLLRELLRKAEVKLAEESSKSHRQHISSILAQLNYLILTSDPIELYDHIRFIGVT